MSLGQRKKKLTPKELREKIVCESTCTVEVWNERVYIRLTGAAAKIPSMKNSKMPGKNFINPEYTAKLQAMDRLFRRAYFGALRYTEPVFVLVILGKRPHRFDEDNALSTVKDWFEPAGKRVGAGGMRRRGWGIGLVDNDNAITGLAIHSYKLGVEKSETVIVAIPLAQVQENLIALIHEILQERKHGQNNQM